MRAIGAALAVVALAAAGCSGRGLGKTAAGTVTTAAVVATSTTEVPATTTSTLAPTSTTKAPPAVLDRCHTSQLSASEGPGNAGLGNVEKIVVFTNTSSIRCRLSGYAGLQRLDDARRPVVTNLRRGGTYFGRDPGPTTIVLPPGATASFALAWVHAPTGDEPQTGCPPSTLAAVTPPDETDPLVLRISMDVCQQGAVTTTAMVAGSEGPPPG